jgi:formylmethanofuran dehydrogenase subunit C
MRGGVLEVKGNAGDFTAEYLAGGEVIIRGNSGDMPGMEMEGAPSPSWAPAFGPAAT